MAKPVTFGSSKPAKPKGDSTSFNFGMNVMTGKEKKAYRKELKKNGHSGGGS